MPSLVRKHGKEKYFGSVYTPDVLVEEVLYVVGYNPQRYPDAMILDPACGDGQFLVAIVKRILQQLPSEQWHNALSKIEGWDIEAQAIQRAHERLEQILKPYGLDVPCKLYIRDSLHFYADTKNTKSQYDFIIGNPPYVRIQHMPDEYKKFIYDNFIFCRSGSTDLYIAFFEMSIGLLKENGKLAFVTSNSWLYTQAAQKLREYLLKESLLETVIDYDDEMPFDGFGAYIAITVLNKQKPTTWRYERRGKSIIHKVMPAGVWVRDNAVTPGYKPLGEVAYIGVGITTLADEVFILQSDKPISNEHTVQTLKTRSGQIVEVETNILKPIIKASTFKGDDGHPKEYIIFPYKLVDGKYKIMTEDELMQYPLAYSYLCSRKDRLLKRDGGKSNPEGWYAFGRHQNLERSFGKKIIFPPMCLEPRFVLSCLEECTVYSGYFIKYDGDYQELLEQLNSKRMYEYLQIHGRPFRGGWRSCSKKVIENFPVKCSFSDVF